MSRTQRRPETIFAVYGDTEIAAISISRVNKWLADFRKGEYESLIPLLIPLIQLECNFLRLSEPVRDCRNADCSDFSVAINYANLISSFC